MKYRTTPDLVEKQKGFWNEDFHSEGDYFSETEDVDITTLILNDEIIKSYKEDDQDHKIVEELKNILIKGDPLPPILIDGRKDLMDGYHRILACQELGITVVPCLTIFSKFEKP